ncbi:MAG: S-layer homology domain-containing protein [Bacillota bacterium]|jgi:Icc-related predicted phosphoesterase
MKTISFKQILSTVLLVTMFLAIFTTVGYADSKNTLSSKTESGPVYVEVICHGEQDQDTLSAPISANELTGVLSNIKNHREGQRELILHLVLEGGESPNIGELSFTAEVLTKLIEAEIDKVTFDCQIGSVTLNKEQLATLKLNDNTDYSISIEKKAQTTPQNSNTPLATYFIKIFAGDERISTLGGYVQIAFPYAAYNEAIENIVIGTYDQKEQFIPLKASAYLENQQSFQALCSQFSSFTLTPMSNSFIDIDNHWAKKYISFAKARKIVNGYGNGIFGAKDSVTRGQFLKILCESLDDLPLDKSFGLDFSDVKKDQWFYKYVAWASANNIIKGFPDGSFKPNEKISREQMAVILDRFTEAVNIDIILGQQASTFKDQHKFSDYARTSIQKMQQAGFLEGRGDNLFAPQGYTTRGEAAKISYTLIEYMLFSNKTPAVNPAKTADQFALSFTNDGNMNLRLRMVHTNTLQRVQFIPETFKNQLPADQLCETPLQMVTTDDSDYRVYQAVMSDLLSDTKYAYRIGTDGAWGNWFTFTTPKADLNKFNFLFMSDTQAIPEIGDYGQWGNLLESSITTTNSDFLLIGGDLINQNNNKVEWEKFYEAADNSFASLPVMVAVGNHDTTNYDFFNLPQNGPHNFEKNFYSFDYGNAHFIVMDSNLMGNEANAALFSEWLKQDLVQAAAQEWKIMMFHHPIFSVSDDGKDIQRALTIQEYYLPIMEEENVDLLLCGHQHSYSRTYPMKNAQISNNGGIIQIMSISGPKFYAPVNHDYLAKTVTNKMVYSILSIDNKQLLITTKDATGKVVDTYTITHN